MMLLFLLIYVAIFCNFLVKQIFDLNRLLIYVELKKLSWIDTRTKKLSLTDMSPVNEMLRIMEYDQLEKNLMYSFWLIFI